MKKYIIWFVSAILAIGLLSFFYFQNHPLEMGKQTDSDDNYHVARVGTETKQENNSIDTSKIESPAIEQPAPASIEEEISSFSTKVSGTKARKNNISICSSLLNGAIVEPGRTFSFWNTVGNTTKEKGYQKAKSFDKDGNHIQTYGGGVCQVSSTLYNAVLASPELEVTERHPHSDRVAYVEEGKDASVCYSSSDFRFVNHTDSRIRIDANYEGKNLTIQLVKLPNR